MVFFIQRADFHTLDIYLKLTRNVCEVHTACFYENIGKKQLCRQVDDHVGQWSDVAQHPGGG